MGPEKLSAAQERILELLQQGYTVTRARRLGRNSVRPAKAWKRAPDGHYLSERISDTTLESLRAAGLIEHQRHETTTYVRLVEWQGSLDLEATRRSA